MVQVRHVDNAGGDRPEWQAGPDEQPKETSMKIQTENITWVSGEHESCLCQSAQIAAIEALRRKLHGALKHLEDEA